MGEQFDLYTPIHTADVGPVYAVDKGGNDGLG